MDSLGALNAFVRTAEVRSFTVAGRQLRVSPSAIGKTISRLEERHGVRLFHRSTRSVSLTKEGHLFLESCRRIMSEIAIIEQEFTQAKGAPAGRLHVSLPSLGGQAAVSLSKFKREYPDIELEVDIGDLPVDVINAGFDVVVRAGDMEDSRLMTRRIASYRLELVASPGYLDRTGRPHQAGDLVDHTCLYLKDTASGRILHWPLSDSRFADRVFPVGAIANSTETLVAFAALGMGVACVPDFAVKQQLANGTLHRILEGCVGYEGSLKAIWPSSRYLSPKLRAFIDFMVKDGLSQVDVRNGTGSIPDPKKVRPAPSKMASPNLSPFSPSRAD